MTAAADNLTSAAILELTKPSGSLGMARPLIAGSGRGDLLSQRDIRNAFASLSNDNKLPLARLVASSECAVVMGRLAASHGDMEDVIALADALSRSAYLFELAGDATISQSRLVEALGLYKRIAGTGHDEANRHYQALAAAMPPAILERVEEDCLRLAIQIEDGPAVEGKRIH